jgi:hypothetical protein
MCRADESLQSQLLFLPPNLSDYKNRAGYWEHMDIALYCKVVGEIQTMGLKFLKLYFFGEALLHPRIGEIRRSELLPQLSPTITILNSARAADDRCQKLHPLELLLPKRNVLVAEKAEDYSNPRDYGTGNVRGEL